MSKLLPYLKKEFNLDRFLILSLILVFLLRLPSLFEPYWYGDEGIYLTLGMAIRKGLVLYQQIHDNKPPVLYLLAAIAGNVAWFRTILLIWMLGTTIIFCKLAQTILGDKNFWTKAATIFFIIFSSIPLIEGNIANAEIFMIGPTILAMWLMYQLLEKNNRYWLILSFLSGIFFSIAFLLKVPAVFDLASLVLFGLFNLTKKNYLKIIKIYVVLAVGFIMPVALSFIYFYFKGALSNYLFAAFLQNFGYVSSWQTGSMNSSGLTSKIGLMTRGGLVAVFFGFLFFFRQHFSKKEILIFLWFALSLFGTLLSERPYPHYLIQVLPALALTVGLLCKKTNIFNRVVSFALIGSLALSIFLIHFWAYGVYGYYLNFINYSLKQESRQSYFQYFGKLNNVYQVAEYLKDKTTDGQKIFIWGDLPHLYALTRTLPPGRYTSTYHIVDFNGYKETLIALENIKPRYIVIDNDEKRPFPEFETTILINYTIEERYGDLIILHRTL